ncbi:hypothetical protein BKA80DRAFT_321625, partial [Phyllosticta citrichinensis]
MASGSTRTTHGCRIPKTGHRSTGSKNPEMLPAIVPQARIMRYGYRSAWFGEHMVSARVSDIAASLLHALERARRDNLNRPIIFSAHSFGGVVLMRALSVSYRIKDNLRKVFESTTGLAFFSTPFRGATRSFISNLVSAVTAQYKDEVDTSVLQTLNTDDQLLELILSEFCEIRNEPNAAMIACFT